MLKESTFFCKPVFVANENKIVDYILEKYIDKISNPSQELYSHPIRLDSVDIQTIKNLLEEPFNLKLFNGLIFRLRANEPQAVHVDSVVKSHGLYTALNIPILNCDQGLMTWFSGDFVEKEMFLPNGVNYNKIDLENSKLVPVYEKNINSPHIVRTDLPHFVANKSPLPRVMLSLRFEKNLDLPKLINEL